MKEENISENQDPKFKEKEKEKELKEGGSKRNFIKMLGLGGLAAAV